jgi:MoxR-like ATPase
MLTLVSATRTRDDIRLGASPRASIALMKACSAWAMLEGRDYVIPEDVAKLTPFILKHRIQLHPKAVIAGKNADSIIKELLISTKI